MTLTRHSLDSPLGEILITTDSSGMIFGLRFAERVWPRENAQTAKTACLRPADRRLGDAVARYFAGDLRAFDQLVIATHNTALHRRVRAALLGVARGSSVSYGEFARAAGLTGPTGAVQIGAVLAANPLALIVPCHRVIGKNGDLKGFAWGAARKRWLLEHEGALRPRSFAF